MCRGIESEKFMQLRWKLKLKEYIYVLCNIEMNWIFNKTRFVLEKKTPKTIWSC